jgi:hypothetical protein
MAVGSFNRQPRQTGPAGFLMFWLDKRIYDLLRSITHVPWRVRREPDRDIIWRVGPGPPLAACQVPKWRARALGGLKIGHF